MEDRDGVRERNESQRERVPERERPRERKERGETEREEGLGTGVTWARAQKSTVSFLRYGHPRNVLRPVQRMRMGS